MGQCACLSRSACLVEALCLPLGADGQHSTASRCPTPGGSRQPTSPDLQSPVTFDHPAGSADATSTSVLFKTLGPFETLQNVWILAILEISHMVSTRDNHICYRFDHSSAYPVLWAQLGVQEQRVNTRDYKTLVLWTYTLAGFMFFCELGDPFLTQGMVWTLWVRPSCLLSGL